MRLARRPGINQMAMALNASLTIVFGVATFACYVTHRYFQIPEVRARQQAKIDRYA